MSSSSSASVSSLALQPLFGNDDDDLQARTALLGALGKVGVSTPAHLVSLAKDGTAIQQLAQSAAIPEVSLLKSDKQAIAFLHLRYERVLRGAISEASKSLEAMGGEESTAFTTLSNALWHSSPSPTLSPPTKILRKLHNDHGAFCDLLVPPVDAASTAKPAKPRSLGDLLLVVFQWVFAVQTLCESAASLALMEYPLRLICIARALGDSAAIEFDLRFRQALSSRARLYASTSGSAYSIALLHCLASDQDNPLLAEIFGKFARRRQSPYQTTFTRSPTPTSTQPVDSFCPFSRDNCPFLKLGNCPYTPSKHLRGPSGTTVGASFSRRPPTTRPQPQQDRSPNRGRQATKSEQNK